MDFGDDRAVARAAAEDGVGQLDDVGERRAATGEDDAAVEPMEKVLVVDLRPDDRGGYSL